MYFIFPQAWIGAALSAAAVAFGPIQAPDVQIKYRNLKGEALGAAKRPNLVYIDKKPEREWPMNKAQCVLVHEYAHLAGRGHSSNRASIMYPVLRASVCNRWLRRHGL